MSFLSGFGSAIKGIGQAIVGTFSVVGGVLGEAISRFIGIPGFILDLFEIGGQKRLSLRFIILRSADGAPLVPVANIEETFKLSARVFDEQAHTTLLNTGVILDAGVAPDDVRNVTSPLRGFLGLWTAAGTYLNTLAGIGPLTRRLSVIIVESMKDDDGRSYGPASNFVLVEKKYFTNPKKPDLTTAHEIGHACGLLHRKPKQNLMHEDIDRHEKLTLWQSALFRGSRFVWYF